MSDESSNSTNEPTRRGFLATMFGSALGLGLTAFAAAAGLWSAGVARFMYPNTDNEPSSRFRVGRPGDYRPGQVESRYKESHGVWVICNEYNGRLEIFALSTVCTHLGCITLWNDAASQFRCPCHGSGFSIDGINLEGPAPRPLERYAICITDDGQLEVDKSCTFRQERGQWTDPNSYVLV